MTASSKTKKKETNKMKKLMIAAAIVCAAIASQASTFKWTSSNKFYFAKDSSGNNIDLTTLKDGDVINAPTSGTKGYADGYSITWTAQMILSTASEDPETLTPAVTISSHKINTSNISSSIFELPAEAGVGKTYSWEVVITGTWKDAKGDEWTVTSNTIEGSKEYSNVTAAEIATASPTTWTVHAPSDVPEPTSAMLLVLGVAGLALRRRRA